LIGDNAVPVISTLSATLKKKTVERAWALDGIDYKAYAPWLCLRPLLSQPIEDRHLLEPSYSPGGLVVDRGYLENISRFVWGQGHAIMKDLPGDPKDWKILGDPAGVRPHIVQSFASARQILERSAFFRAIYPSLVEMVIPLEREKSCGFSSMLARGVVFRSFHKPYTAATLALDVAHEMGHQALILLQSVDPLISSDLMAPVFSEIRKQDRPAIQSLHAAAALAYMLILSRSLKNNNEESDAVRQREAEYGGSSTESVSKAIHSLKQKCQFTPMGSKVISEFEQIISQ
jgi:hypothetical protein